MKAPSASSTRLPPGICPPCGVLPRNLLARFARIGRTIAFWSYDSHDYERLPAATLMPTVVLDDTEFVVYLPELAAVPTRLMRKRVANLESSRDLMTRGLDLLFSGI